MGDHLDTPPTTNGLQWSSDQQKILTHPHYVTSSWGGWRQRRLAFTEHGAIMAATILDSSRAVQMSVYVVRPFARLRQVVAAHSKLAQELQTLKQSVATLDADTRRPFDQAYETILGLMATSPRKQLAWEALARQRGVRGYEVTTRDAAVAADGGLEFRRHRAPGAEFPPGIPAGQARHPDQVIDRELVQAPVQGSLEFS